MLKMTIISLDSLFNIQAFVLNMEKMIKIPKRAAPNSLALKLGGQARWNQCDSFSSCSDDSTAYCSNFNGNHISTIHQSPRLIKRSRHSSGSSASSNLSCVSDKESSKLSLTLSSSVTNCSTNTSVRSTRSTNLNCSDVKSRSLEYKHKTIIKKTVPCHEVSESISPFRHNLRRNIRKKKCSCDCSSTCETLVVRRYNELEKKSMNSKALITSAKISTFMPNNSVTVIQNTSKSDSGRKRRSEVEKLYESLHEIEWAKNFSPDNILTQFNIRQAASCSIFGRSPNHNLSNKNKKQKVINKQRSKTNVSVNNLSRTPVYKCSENFTYSSDNANLKKTNSDLESFRIQPNFHQYGKTDNSLGLKSKEKFLSRKFSHVEAMKSDVPTVINSSQLDKMQSSSLISVIDDDDAQCSSNSDDVSVISVHTNDLLSNSHNCNFLSHSNKELSESANSTEYTLIPSFYDIAEEGIRTIDACFREVGAEVVVSTCYENGQNLPLLSAVKDNVSSESALNDVPPVLKPSVDISGSNVQSKQNHSHADETSIVKKITDVQIKPSPTKSKRLHTYKKKIRTKLFLKRKHVFQLGKQIIKKYCKYVLGRRKLKNLSSLMRNSHKKKVEVKDCLLSNKRTLCKTTKNYKLSNQKNNLEPDESPLTIKTSEYKYQKIEHQEIVKSEKSKISIFSSSDGLRVDYVNDTTVVGTKKESTFSSAMQKVTNTLSVAQTIQHTSKSSPHFLAKIESTQKSFESKQCLQALQPKKSSEFGSNYKSLQVNLARNYVQVILKVTRSNAIFLTLDALLELTDVVTKVNADQSCQVLIIHGSADCFCLGLDLKPLVGSERNKFSSELAIGIKNLIEALASLRKPLVAVINGPAVGLGVTILNHADIKIASKNATFSMPYSLLGYTPEGGATVTLPQAVGSTVAMDLLLRGRTLTALEAKSVGLISEVCEDKYLPQELVSRVKILNNNSFSAMEVTKGLIQIPLFGSLQLVLENEVKLLPRMWLTDSCQVAMKSAFNSGLLPFK